MSLNGEINPNHPVVNEMREQWYKIAAILLRRLGGRAVISTGEISQFADDPRHNIVIDTRGGISLTVSLVSDDEAMQVAHKEGGLPV